jgi:hypothetical protein
VEVVPFLVLYLLLVVVEEAHHRQLVVPLVVLEAVEVITDNLAALAQQVKATLVELAVLEALIQVEAAVVLVQLVRRGEAQAALAVLVFLHQLMELQQLVLVVVVVVAKPPLAVAGVQVAVVQDLKMPLV